MRDLRFEILVIQPHGKVRVVITQGRRVFEHLPDVLCGHINLQMYFMTSAFRDQSLAQKTL